MLFDPGACCDCGGGVKPVCVFAGCVFDGIPTLHVTAISLLDTVEMEMAKAPNFCQWLANFTPTGWKGNPNLQIQGTGVTLTLWYTPTPRNVSHFFNMSLSSGYFTGISCDPLYIEYEQPPNHAAGYERVPYKVIIST